MASSRSASSGSSGSSRPPGPSARSSATSGSRWPTAPAARPRARLVEGLLAPAFGMSARRRRDGRRPRDHHRRVRGQAAALPGRVDRRARGQRHGQRPGDGRGEAAGAHAQPDPRGGPRPRTCCAPRSTRSPRAAEAAGVRIVGGDTKVVERGHADGMYITTTGLGRRDPRAAFAPPRPGDRILLSGPIGAHGTAIMLARGEFELDADIESDTRRCGPRSTRSSVPAASACMRDATRGGVASVLNELARAAGVAMLVREAARARPARGRRRLRAARHRSDVRRQRGRLRGDRRARRRGRPGFAEHRRGPHRAARHGAGRDELRRQAGDGRAGRRSRCRGSADARALDRRRHRAHRAATTRTGGEIETRRGARSGTCARSCPTRSPSRSPSSPRGRTPRAPSW